LTRFDIDQRYQDDEAVGSAMSRREGVLISVAFHGLTIVAALLVPQLPFVQELLPEPPLLEVELVPEVAQSEDEARFVFVQPRVDVPVPESPLVAELSDRDRQAQDPEMASLTDNALPFSLGNSPERVEEVPEETLAERSLSDQRIESESTIASLDPVETSGLDFTTDVAPAPPGEGELLADAIRNLDRYYIQGQTFNNPQGGADEPGAAIQFDTRGVDFGPWLRRFIAEVYRNWNVPESAYAMRGVVVLQFNIHKNGRIADITVFRPSAIEGFNIAAYNAIWASRLDPLPEEYDLDPAFFTVTFFYGVPRL
jgi:TonB family protein